MAAAVAAASSGPVLQDVASAVVYGLQRELLRAPIDGPQRRAALLGWWAA